jgi:hypothetical protein
MTCLTVAYQNALASSLTNFIGLAIEREYKRGQGASMAYLGKDIGLPEEIIELRHTCGHRELPNTEVLEEACDFCFSWLREKYWEPQAEQYNEELRRLDLTAKRRNIIRQIVHRYLNANSAPAAFYPDAKRQKIDIEATETIDLTNEIILPKELNTQNYQKHMHSQANSEILELSSKKCLGILTDLIRVRTRFSQSCVGRRRGRVFFDAVENTRFSVKNASKCVEIIL